MLESDEVKRLLAVGRISESPPMSPFVKGWAKVYDVRVEEKNLYFSLNQERSKLWKEDDRVMKGFSLLEAFLRLADIPEKHFGRAVLNFAKRYGVLGICHHGLPAAHRPIFPYGAVELEPDKLGTFSLEDNIISSFNSCHTQGNRKRERCEPLSSWKEFARKAKAMCKLAIELRLGNVGDKEDWDLVKGNSIDLPSGTPPNVGWGRKILSLRITDWLNMCAVKPRFIWKPESRYGDLVLEGLTTHQNVLAAVTIQMMLLVSGAPDYALCAECGKPFLLRRGQSAKGRAFCKQCKNAAQKQAVKKYQQKLREAQRRGCQRGHISEKQAQAIKRMLNKYEGRKLPLGFVKQLADKYGVTVWQIYKIKQGKSRKSVSE